MKNSVFALAAILCGCATQATQEPAASADAQAANRTAQATPARPAQPTTSVTSAGIDAKVVPSKRSIYYAYDQADLTPESRKVVEANADYLRQNPKLKVVVEGNADERGSAEYNVALGQRRADGVSKIMTLLGINSDRIETVSLGKEKPKVVGHDESAWSQNRRSDIVFR